MRLTKPEETKSLTGLILITGIALVTLGLFTQDTSLLWFSIPIIFSLIIAISRGSHDIDEAVKSIGIAGTNIQTSVPLGIIAGMVVFIVGSLFVSYTAKNTSSLVPVFAIASLTPATTTLIPASAFLLVNVLIQFFVVAPAEELGWRFLTPYALYSFSKSIPFAMFFGTVLWMFTHVPTFILQGISQSMYIVLLMLGVTSIALIYYTSGIIASWIAHATFNILVLVLATAITSTTIISMVVIMFILFLIYVKGGDKLAKSKSPYNL